MGVADLLPGISGGSVALALGIYPELIGAISDFSHGRWKRSLKTLIPIGCGILAALVAFSPIVALLIRNKLFLCGIFALLLTATYAVYKQCQTLLFTPLTIGFILVCAFQFLSGSYETLPAYSYLVFGLFAAVAMLLPGISGSTLMLLLGTYHPLIGHVSAVSRGLFHSEHLAPLLFFALGALSGLLLTARLLSKVLQHFPQQTHSFLLGLMTGGTLLFSLYFG